MSAKTPHVHAAVIKAWADGAQVESRVGYGHPWAEAVSPVWYADREYRVKPAPKPDIHTVCYITMYRDQCKLHPTYADSPSRFVADVAVYFDGETGKLKEVKLIKNEFTCG